MRKTTAGAVVAAATTFVGLALAASPAAADVDVRAGCSSSNVCLYENNDYNNDTNNNYQDFDKNIRDFNDWNWKGTDDGMDNETSSIRNRSGCTAVLYQHVGYDGDSSAFGPGADDGHLGDNNIGDNRASSLKIIC